MARVVELRFSSASIQVVCACAELRLSVCACACQTQCFCSTDFLICFVDDCSSVGVTCADCVSEGVCVQIERDNERERERERLREVCVHA